MLGSIISAGLGLFGANKAAKAAEKAAQYQYKAAQEATQLQRDMYNQTRGDLAPWRTGGADAFNAYLGELGLVDGFESKFQESPGYQFAVNQGEQGVMNNLAALGMKNSGAALKSLTDYRTGMANQEYGNYLTRLMGASGQGLSAAGQTASAGQNAAAGMANTIQNAGAAQASGVIGSNNAWMGGLNQVGNALGQMSQGASSYGGNGLSSLLKSGPLGNI